MPLQPHSDALNFECSWAVCWGNNSVCVYIDEEKYGKTKIRICKFNVFNVISMSMADVSA